MTTYRVLTASDLHQRSSLYAQLAVAVAVHKPDLLACVGDFLDAEFPPPSAGMLSAEDAAVALSEMPCELVLIRGNHDADEVWTDFEACWKSTGRPLHALHGTAARFGPLCVIGFPCWLGEDTSYGTGRELEQYSPSAWLPQLLKRTGPAGRALWLMHEPPSPVLGSRQAWEPEWGDAVADYQPVITVSGHDHGTPLETGKWETRIGNTRCINVGQRVYPRPGELLYCVFDFTFEPDSRGLPTAVKVERFGAKRRARK